MEALGGPDGRDTKQQRLGRTIGNNTPRHNLHELLNCVNNFNFNWMMAYEYASDVQPLLPAGSVLHFTSWHNNTPSNKLNLDAGNWTGYGQRSIDDMSVAWVTYYNMSEEQFKQAVAERNANSKQNLSSKLAQ